MAMIGVRATAESMTGRVAIVTGGTGVVGIAIAAELARCGARVAITGRDRERGAAALAEIGGTSCFLPHDATDPPSWREVVEAVLERWGRLDGLVNGVGGSGPMADILDVDVETFAHICDLNIRTALVGMQAGHAAMRHQGGAIVNIGSVAATYVQPLGCGYCASKTVLPALARGAAAQFAADRVRVNNVHPGVVGSAMAEENFARNGNRDAYLAMIPLRRLADPADVARVTRFLLTDQAVGISGTDIVVDGGRTIF